MSIFSKMKSFFNDPGLLPRKLSMSKIAEFLPDKFIVQWQFELFMGYKLNLKSPQTFNEKLQWLKLNDRNKLYSQLVDKYNVRAFVASVIGEEYLIPLLAGPYKKFEDIDFAELPEQFAIKCTHDSGGNIICKDKASLDLEAARRKINKSLQTNFFYRFREWAYKDVEPQIIVEKYMKNSDLGMDSLRDYKFFVFGGETKFLYISNGMGGDHSTAQCSFVDLNGEIMPFTRKDYTPLTEKPELPKNFHEMVQMSDKLAKAIGNAFARIDLYEIDGKIYFSEITLYPNAGMIPFSTMEADKALGNMINIAG